MPSGKTEGKIESTEVRRLIEMEVTRQLAPIHSLLESVQSVVQSVKAWQLSFWSNGDKGRPPGFFQTRIKADDERYSDILTEVTKLNDHREVVDQFILELRLAREYREKREKESKERRKMMLKVGASILTGLLSLIGWGVSKAVPVVEILWQDYLKAHPSVSEQMKNMSKQDPAYAGGKSQDAQIFHQ